MQNDTVLLCDVFENFCEKCLKTYDLLKLLTYLDTLLMAEKGIRDGINDTQYFYLQKQA